MHPAFSVIFFTTLAGAGQGLFIALVLGQVYALAVPSLALGPSFFVGGGILALILLALGLVASVFHLGHPMRGWRAFSQWRTSWLSREVIALPFFMFTVFLYTGAHILAMDNVTTLSLALLGLIADFALFVCTGMIYACLKFLREWATPLTVVNFIFFGVASGFSIATVYAYFAAEQLVTPFAIVALAFTLASLVTRTWVLARNTELRAKPKSTTQSAIGIRHPQVKQTSMGQMGGSYNTREFFHGKTQAFVRNIKTIFLLTAFVIPAILHSLGLVTGSVAVFALALVIHLLGLLAERWHFFAQVNHPQNLYYQTVS